MKYYHFKLINITYWYITATCTKYSVVLEYLHQCSWLVSPLHTHIDDGHGVAPLPHSLYVAEVPHVSDLVCSSTMPLQGGVVVSTGRGAVAIVHTKLVNIEPVRPSGQTCAGRDSRILHKNNLAGAEVHTVYTPNMKYLTMTLKSQPT